MNMTPRLRKFVLITHITFSVGWLGAVAGFLALAIAGLTSPDAQRVRAAYLAMELTAWFVILPLAFASLVTGIIRVTRHCVGIVPTLLGPGETHADRLCHYRLAAENEIDWLCSRRSGREDVVRR